jgi:putative ATP-grasp target RiPP
MKREPVRIDDISALGVELTDDELAGLAGGRPPNEGCSSKSGHIDGSSDLDQDF